MFTDYNTLSRLVKSVEEFLLADKTIVLRYESLVCSEISYANNSHNVLLFFEYNEYHFGVQIHCVKCRF